MREDDEINEKNKYYLVWLEKNKTKIPNCNRLIKLLKSDKKAGHVIHAMFVKKFVEGEKFEVTDVEKKYEKYDIDIELDNHINLQVWYGASVSTHNIIKRKISDLGGVETNLSKDEEKIKKKLRQLPDDNLGLLLCYNYHFGIVVLPDWEEKIPTNKAIAELFHINYGNGIQNEARLYYSENFKYFDLVKEILSSLSFPIKKIEQKKDK